MRLLRWSVVLGLASLALLESRPTTAYGQPPRACGSWYRGSSVPVWYLSTSNSPLLMFYAKEEPTSFYNGDGQSSEIQAGSPAMPRAERGQQVLPLSEMGNQNFPIMGP